MNSISIDELLKIVPSSSIIDIRSSQSYNNNHIPGAINVPYEKLIVRPDAYLNFKQNYYLYCQKGVSSKKVVSILNRMGYHTIHVEGGYEEWIMKK